MRSFDLEDVHEPSTASNQKSSWESELRDRKISSSAEGSGSIGEALGPFQVFSDLGVGLHELKLLVRVEIRILIVEADDKPDMNEIWFHVVEERTCVVVWTDRPADRMLNVSGLKQLMAVLDFPNLLESDAVQLRVAFISQIKLLDDFFTQRPPCSFRKDGLLPQNLHPPHEGLFGLPFFGNAEILGGDSLDMSFLSVEDFGARSSSYDVDAKIGGFLPHPPCEFTERDYVVSVVIDGFGEEESWNING